MVTVFSTAPGVWPTAASKLLVCTLNSDTEFWGNWNAMSLPWAVGPKGRIARLDEQALKAMSTKK